MHLCTMAMAAARCVLSVIHVHHNLWPTLIPQDKHHLVMQMMDARILDISSEGKIEVSEVAQNEFHFDSIQIVDIVTREPKDWKVLHTERLRGTNPGAPALQVTPPAPSESASPTASGSPKSNGASTTTAVAPDSTTETKQNGNHGTSLSDCFTSLRLLNVPS